ncbi:pyridoxamine 5'-phosphate oxidase family protein [Luteibacter aegosomatis]|uniref:pyridoxamine 5'-phosphate oxidase family protein n=1 Tax=Luteibacter aegosomatis TaxID=2911537 RepID=UPI001FFAC4A6|nr:pyridoxamine 5'-phosphate oxidase family protein [Luteibacter aegosomatis]UPG85596.1 pyridoxamine 5'-phosphate oxidase family protein [Luteibacter aegosomatis]
MYNKPNFHEGELQAQAMAHESDIAARNASNVADHIIRPALPFVRQQRMVYAASVDAVGRVWASVLIGERGFLEPSDDASTLTIHLDNVIRQAHDPLWSNIEQDGRIGLLLLELQTRKRLKINGQAHLESDRLVVEVTESVPICPRYIQRRTIELPSTSDKLMPTSIKHGLTLEPGHLNLLQSTDTFFLATAHKTHGADITHRGGPSGFVEVLADGKLRIPDYNGNGMFNSAGNVLIDPRAGLVFPDYVQRRMLQLTGRAEMLWDQPDPKGVTGGTGRFWQFQTSAWIETQLPEQLSTAFVDASPFLPQGI